MATHAGKQSFWMVHDQSAGGPGLLSTGLYHIFHALGTMAHELPLEPLTLGLAQVAGRFFSVQIGLYDSFKAYESRVPSGLHQGLIGGKSVTGHSGWDRSHVSTQLLVPFLRPSYSVLTFPASGAPGHDAQSLRVLVAPELTNRTGEPHLKKMILS